MNAFQAHPPQPTISHQTGQKSQVQKTFLDLIPTNIPKETLCLHFISSYYGIPLPPTSLAWLTYESAPSPIPTPSQKKKPLKSQLLLKIKSTFFFNSSLPTGVFAGFKP